MHSTTRQTILASSTLTLALVSDAVLYLLLPVFFDDFLISIVWVGVLLAANRFLRIVLNPLIVRCYAYLGNRRAALLAVLLACLGCAMFLYPLGPWPLLIARLLWGFAYGLLRLGCLYAATSNAQQSLKNMGWYSSIQEIGPLLVLAVAPWLSHYYSPQLVILLSLVLCLLAFIPALLMASEGKALRAEAIFWLPQLKLQHIQTFVFCLLLESLWLIILAPMFISSGWSQTQAVGMAALLVVFKRSFNLLLGLILIKYSPPHSAQRGVFYAVLLMVIAVWFLAGSSLIIGSVLGIIGHGVFMILMPKLLSDKSTDSLARKRSLNDFTLWRDFAAALGALLAGMLLAAQWVTAFYIVSALLLSVFVVINFLLEFTARRASRRAGHL